MTYFPDPKAKVPVPPSTPHKAGAAGVGSAVGTAIGVAAVAWLNLEGELALTVIGACSALGAAVLAYVVKNYLTNPEAATRTLMSKTMCHPLAVAIAVLLLLSACTTPLTERVRETLQVACLTLDNQTVAFTVDLLGAAANQTDRIELIRETRRAVCAANEMTFVPIPEPRP